MSCTLVAALFAFDTRSLKSCVMDQDLNLSLHLVSQIFPLKCLKPPEQQGMVIALLCSNGVQEGQGRGTTVMRKPVSQLKNTDTERLGPPQQEHFVFSACST